MLRRFFRGFVALIGLIAQIAYLIFVLWIIGKHTVLFGDQIGIANILFQLYGLFLILVLVKDSKNYSYALPWIMIIILFPIVGTLLYIVLR